MNYKTSVRLYAVCMAVGAVLAVISLVSKIQVLGVVALIIMLAGMVEVGVFCRCPHCNKPIKISDIGKKCPNCGKKI